MQVPAWSGSAATPRTFFRLASSSPPAHGLRRDRLQDKTLDSESLQVGQSFLEGKPLLIEVLARTPQLHRNLPAGLFISSDDLEDLVEPALMVRGQRFDTTGHIGERTPVRRQDQRRPSLGHPLEDRKSTRLNSSHVSISYAVFCFKQK